LKPTLIIENYLHELIRIRNSGAAVDETSYYPALSNLLNEIGKTMSPKVTCIMPITNQGAGFPDGGIFSIQQISNLNRNLSTPLGIPERGVLEAKPTNVEVNITASGQQVTKYWNKYKQVLVTNYRSFLLIGRDENGDSAILEPFNLAQNENEFWLLAATPKKTANEIGARFVDYLKRVMNYSVPLSDPKDVAWILASYARESKARIETQDLPALSNLKTALEEALGMKFEGKRGLPFFKSTLIQTLFYGVFSAWVIWSKQQLSNQVSGRFEWEKTSWYLNIPVIRQIFEQIATPSSLRPLELVEILDWTEEVLNRINRKEFFNKFEEKYAVQYFYEPFLEEFDPVLRKELGVWYTPPEIVEYMVARVDTVLREELGIEDGLAGEQVYILDPAVGTGSYLLEVLRTIANTMATKGKDALFAHNLKTIAQERVFGFEILPAPYIVAHLQIGLLLQNYGAHFSNNKNERISVYLTNSLTGWDLSRGPQGILNYPELEKEREESDQIKRNKPILVVLGNPPYNAFAGISPEEEQGLVEPYKEGLSSKWKITKNTLDDLYIRFFRIAERRIVEQTGSGVICYISNFSYLIEPQFVVMRERFLNEFDKIWIDCLNGSSRETGKKTPDGKPDPSVFSTRYNKAGIRLGTTIGLFVRTCSEENKKADLRFRNFWGKDKLSQLLKSKSQPNSNKYLKVNVVDFDRFSFKPAKTNKNYKKWPSIIDFSLVAPLNGPIERRGNSLIVFEKEIIKFDKLNRYLDSSYTDDQIRVLEPKFMKSSGEFDATKTRKKLLLKKVKFSNSDIRPYSFKPMDIRLSYLNPEIQPLFSRPNPELIKLHALIDNKYLITRDTADKTPEGPPFYYSKNICDYDFISGHARHFPIYIKNRDKNTNKYANGQFALDGKLIENDVIIPNVSDNMQNYLQKLNITQSKTDKNIANLLWLHILSIGYSPKYLSDNGDGVRRGWPRVPLPKTKDLFLSSVVLGEKIAAILDGEQISGITTGKIRPDLNEMGVISHILGKSLDPNSGDLQINAGWGYEAEAVMPGSGNYKLRDFSDEEKISIEKSAQSQNISSNDMIKQLGNKTYDIYLNDSVYWKNVPLNVWEYVIGGYQVLKKWLSYREYAIIHRSITPEEAFEFTLMTRRIAFLILLEPQLDLNYDGIANDSYLWN
jgi:hypothetical protein